MKKLVRFLVLPLALCLTASACDKGKSGGGGSGGPTGAAGASAISPAQGGLKRALAAMPKDTDAIFGVDLAQLRASGLYKKYEPMIKQKIGDKLEEFKGKCGFDPLEKISGLLIAGKGQKFESMTMFVRGFEKGPVIECIKKVAEEAKAKGETDKEAIIDGDYVGLKKSDGETINFMFVDDKTILVIRDGENTGDKAALQAAASAKDGDGLTGSPGFTKLLDSVKTGSTLWFVMNGQAPMFGAMPFKLKAVLGWVNVGSGVDGEMRMRMSSKDEATTIVTMANSQMDQIKNTPYAEYAKSIKLSASGEDAVVSFKLDEKQVDSLASTMGGMMGGGGF